MKPIKQANGDLFENEKLKQCCVCKEWFPATTEYFHKRGGSSRHNRTNI